MFNSRLSHLFSLVFFLFVALFNSTTLAYDERFTLTTSNNEEYALEINLKNGHKIYWLNPGDSGEATQITFDDSANLNTSTILWPFPTKDIYDEKITNYIYEGNVKIPLILSPIEQNQPTKLKINLSYIICGDQCAPVKQTIKKDLLLNNITPYHNHMRIRNEYYDSGILYFDAYFSSTLKEIPQFILVAEDMVFSTTSLVAQQDDHYIVVMPIAEEMFKKLSGQISVVYSNAVPEGVTLKLPSLSPNQNSDSTPLYLVLGMALVGGFILNFMPCVLPVLALKLISATKLVKNYRSSFLATIFGIICSFWLLSIATITMKDLGKSFGIGMGFQQIEFIILLTVLIILFISISLGRINVAIPSFVQNINALGSSVRYFEDFIGGVIATFLSVPCTAPFLGSAMAVAFLSDTITNFLIFTFTAIGFSLPYLILILSPKLIFLLPKSGDWMEKIKKFLSILLIGSLVWLLSILAPQLGPRATFGLVLLLILIKYVIEEHSNFLKYPLWKITAAVILTICCIYLPQLASKQDDEHNDYITSLWQELSPSAIEGYIKQNKIVIVDITADWCITCKYNKLLIWDRRSAIKLLNDPSIVAMRGDMTIPDPKIEQYLLSNQKYGIPFNIVYGPGAPNGVVLPVLFSFEDLTNAIKKAR